MQKSNQKSINSNTTLVIRSSLSCALQVNAITITPLEIPKTKIYYVEPLHINNHFISLAERREKYSSRRNALLQKARKSIAVSMEEQLNTETFVSLRLAKGLNQSQLAKLTGFPQPYISRIENNRIDISSKNIKILADSLAVPEHRVRESLNMQWTILENKA